MATYQYACSDCNAVIERVQSMNESRPESVPCIYCAGQANFILSAVAVLTGGMSNSPIDVSVGREAEARWASINARQEKRNQVRRDANKQGLTATDYKTFVPITSEQKATRTRALDYVARDGHKPDLSDGLTRTAEGK